MVQYYRQQMATYNLIEQEVGWLCHGYYLGLLITNIKTLISHRTAKMLGSHLGIQMHEIVTFKEQFTLHCSYILSTTKYDNLLYQNIPQVVRHFKHY